MLKSKFLFTATRKKAVFATEKNEKFFSFVTH